MTDAAPSPQLPRAGVPFRRSLSHLFGNPSLYRFGFLASPEPLQGDTIWRRLNWRTEQFRGLTYWLHPETPFEIRGEWAVIGHAFNLDADKPIETALDGAFGRFVVVDGDTVYNDAFGSRSVFYRDGVFASHAALISHALGVGRSRPVRRILDSAAYQKKTVRYLPGDLTVYDGVHALIPNHRLTPQGLRRYWPRAPLAATTREAVVGAATDHLRALADALRDRPVAFGLTGGADTRAVAAAFDGRFSAVTWTWGYIDREELPIVDALVRLFSVPHRYLEPSRGTPCDICLRNAGNFRKPPRIPALMADALSADTVFIRGYGGEIIRGFYQTVMKTPMSALTPDEMLRLYGRGDGEYGRLCLKAFEGMMSRGDYADPMLATYDPNDIFYWEHRMGMWGSAMLNEMDAAVLSLVGFNSRPLFTAAFGLDAEERFTKELLSSVSEKLDPRLKNVKIL